MQLMHEINSWCHFPECRTTGLFNGEVLATGNSLAVVPATGRPVVLSTCSTPPLLTAFKANGRQAFAPAEILALNPTQVNTLGDVGKSCSSIPTPTVDI